MPQQQTQRSRPIEATPSGAPSLAEASLPAFKRTAINPGAAATSVQNQSIQDGYYKVRAGDTISAIAKRFETKQSEITALNPSLDPNKISVGQLLRMPDTNTQPTLHTPLGTPSRQTLVINQTPPLIKEGAPFALSGPLVRRIDSVRASPALTSAPPAPFYASLIQTLNSEGGKTNNSNDRAHQNGVGVTNLGITGAAMSSYVQRTEGRTPSNSELTERINNLKTEQAVEVYATGYWRGDLKGLGPKLSSIAFDWGVTSGPTTPIRQFQKYLGLPVTGVVDSLLTKKISEMGEESACHALTKCRKEFYTEIAEKRPKNKVFLEGWLTRCDVACQYALSPRHEALIKTFEHTSPGGCDLFDPVSLGVISLKRGTQEKSLTRILQERLSDIGYKVKQDGIWGSEMDGVVQSFKSRHELPGKPEWGVKESGVLNSLRQGRTKGGLPIS